jgi:predicted nucleic acid-binding protein
VPFVLDASVALSWHFEDEVSPYADSVLDRLGRDTAHVPSLWSLEVTNGLVLAERKRLLTSARFLRAVELSLSLPVVVHEFSLGRVLDNVAGLAREYNLAAYDAAYLDLAIREGLPIATQDDDLLAATRRAGLPDLDIT